MEKDKKKRNSLFRTILSLAIFLAILFLLLNYTTYFKETLNFEKIAGNFDNFIPKIVFLILLFFIFKLLYVLLIDIIISKIRPVFLRRERFESVKRLISFFWWFFYVIIVLTLLVSNVGAIVASLGLIGLGLTFALQKPILNFVGWLTIIFKDIYNEGDRIKVGKIAGDVKEIQLMNTVVYSLLENSNQRSEKTVTIPNELVLTQEVENFNKDSNYIREELIISITYESNYHKAMKLLEEITEKHIKKIFKSFIKFKQDQSTELDDFLKKLVKKGSDNLEQKEIIKKEREDIKKEIDELITLSEEFIPKIRLELADSAVLLIAQFLTPYLEVKKNRTAINIAFLDAIAKEKDIDVAYPHMEIVYDRGKK